MAKGELGKEIEQYLNPYGLVVQLDGRPLQFEQRIGKRMFRPMQSKDVPWYVAQRAEYGITGNDLVCDYLLGLPKRSKARVKVLEELDFGYGDLVFFRRKGEPIKKKPVIATPRFYENLLRWGPPGLYLLAEFQAAYDVLPVSGSTEGFVRDGSADLGFDFTTYFRKPPEDRKRTTIASNGLEITERVMDTKAVAIAKDLSSYTSESYRKMLQGPYDLAWQKMSGMIPVAVEDVGAPEITTLMVAYANQNALETTLETGLATFWSRGRNKLWTKGLEESGNTMDVVDVRTNCYSDSLLYRVIPKGPACHTGEQTCFYRPLQEFKRT